MQTKILVIDDEQESRYILSTILREHGYEVIQADDGNAGLEAAKQAKPALILLDLILPDMHGYEIAKTLRSTPSLAHIPILAVSSLPLMGNEKHALAAGCDAYVEKPIVAPTLIQQVQDNLATHNI